MTDVVCAGCGSTQRAGAPFCAACGREFPRTGRPVVEPALPPRGQVQQTAAAAARGGSGSVPMVESRPPITTEVEVYTATQIPSAGMMPKQMGEPYAGVGKRFLAYLVDGVIAGALAGVVVAIGLAFVDIPSGLVVLSAEQQAELAASMLRVYLIAGAVSFAFMLSMWIWESRTGRTVGNSMLGLRTVSADDRGPLGFGRELVRVLMFAAVSLIPAAGSIIVHLTPKWDKGDKVQGWHDKAARSVVLDIRAPQIVVSSGLAPVAPGPRAPGKPALRTAAPSAPTPSAPAPGQYAPAQMPPLSPAAPQAPAQPPMAAQDPWSFPQGPAAGAPAPAGNGLITGIPGSAPAAQPPAQPAQPPMPAQQQPEAWPAKTWPVQEPAAPPMQRPELPPQQHPESRPTRRTTLPQDGAARPAAGLPPHGDDLSDRTRMQPVLEPAGVVTVTIELESGARHVIDGPALVGRNPQAGAGSAAILVRVEDPTRSVSKNHAELGVDSAGLWLTDRGSTNGTVVSAPGRSPQVAEPGARVRVPVGSTIHVGDRRILVHPNGPRA